MRNIQSYTHFKSVQKSLDVEHDLHVVGVTFKDPNYVFLCRCGSRIFVKGGTS